LGQGDQVEVTAFYTSVVVTVLLIGAIVRVGHKRTPWARLTWGEAFAASLFGFGMLLMIYGVIPDRFLKWADGELKWRSDKLGIPLGPFGHYLHSWFGIGKNNLLWPNGIKFGGRGKINFTAQDMRDIVATVIYGVAIGAHFFVWSWWQKRGKKAEQPAIAPSSAYGRPLVRGS
jgi:hypothetical protein